MWLNQLFNIIWLVVSTPLKNISKFWLLFPYIMEKKHVPNHQPDYKMVGGLS